MDLRDPMLWISIYDNIRSDLGFSEEADSQSAALLNSLLSSSLRSAEEIIGRLNELMNNSRTLIVGAYDTCLKCVDLINEYDAIIAADGAVRCCLSVNIVPDVIVSDLDGISGDETLLNSIVKYKPIMVIHAHGDNIELIRRIVPILLGHGLECLGTCQVAPFGRLRIFGGFTDGDRAAYLSYFFKSLKIGLIGFKLGEVTGRYSKPWMRGREPAKPIKVRKLKWARILLTYLRIACRGEGIEWIEEG